MIDILYRNSNFLEILSEQLLYIKISFLFVTLLIFSIVKNSFKVKKIKNIKSYSNNEPFKNLYNYNETILNKKLISWEEYFKNIVFEEEKIQITAKKLKSKKKKKKTDKKTNISSNEEYTVRPKINSKNKDPNNISNLSLEKNLVNMLGNKDEDYNKQNFEIEFSELSKNSNNLSKSNQSSSSDNLKNSFINQKNSPQVSRNGIKKNLDNSDNAGNIGDTYKLIRQNSSINNNIKENESGYSHFKIESIGFNAIKDCDNYYYKFDQNLKFLGQNNPLNLLSNLKKNDDIKISNVNKDSSFYFNNSFYRENSKIFNLDNKDINHDFSINNSDAEDLSKLNPREKRISKLKEKIFSNSLKKYDNFN